MKRPVLKKETLYLQCFHHKDPPVYKIHWNFEIPNKQIPPAASRHWRSTNQINTGEKAEDIIPHEGVTTKCAKYKVHLYFKWNKTAKLCDLD